MRVTEVTTFHRVSAFIFFKVFKRPLTHYVTSFAKFRHFEIFALPELLELPKYASS
jgi:hypothetical protein